MNRHVTLIILVLLLSISTQAQKRISREYNNVSLSDALKQLSEQQTGYTDDRFLSHTRHYEH